MPRGRPERIHGRQVYGVGRGVGGRQGSQCGRATARAGEARVGRCHVGGRRGGDGPGRRTAEQFSVQPFQNPHVDGEGAGLVGHGPEEGYRPDEELLE